jgi:hypothetical protein
MMAKKSKSAPPPSKPAVILKSISAVKQPSPSAAAKLQAKAAAPVAPPAPAKQAPVKQEPPKTAPVKTPPVKAAPAPAKAAQPAKQAPVSKPASPLPAQAGLVDPSALIETLATRRQESLNNAIAQLHALHSQMLHAAGRHANTALQFLNNAPKSGTLTDMIEWQSRWFLSHAHVHQDGVKALGTLASQNIEHLQKSLRVDLPLKAS